MALNRSIPHDEHEAKLKVLEDALIKGERSGPPVLFDSKAFLKNMREKHAR
jgi:antitoxin ParD1/3/4